MGQDSASPPRAKQQETGRVLVMDDEAAVLRLAERALRDAGYATKVVSTAATRWKSIACFSPTGSVSMRWCST